MMRNIVSVLLASTLGISAFAAASAQAPMGTATTVAMPASTYQVVLISRTVEAVNYRYHSGSTGLDFTGTSLEPSTTGKAKIESKRGTIEVIAKFENLQPPTTFGNEYLTYVLWAISPEGRAVNLGEVLIGGDEHSKVEATTDLQAFALIVTAEPYYAVRQPSDVVVLENSVRNNTKGSTVPVDVKYELMERGGYIPSGYSFSPVVMNAHLPLEFFEAQNAIRIAKSEGADIYAADSFQKAVQLLNTADAASTNNSMDVKALIATSREVVQTAEDSREIAVKKISDMNIAMAQAASDAVAVNAMQQADAAQAATTKAQSDMAANKAAAASALALSQAQTNNANQQAANAQADAANAQAQAAQSNAALQQSENDKAMLRTRLIMQLNAILQTRDSARGLIISMSDVLFDTGKYSLKPGAREKLAKVAGILLAYPSLNIAVGGYTDNVGGDAMNQTLSENRADSVRDYLVSQGVAASALSATGYGDTSPVTSNDNAAGRQENRRVELVVSGDMIGNTVIVTTGNLVQ